MTAMNDAFRPQIRVILRHYETESHVLITYLWAHVGFNKSYFNVGHFNLNNIFLIIFQSILLCLYNHANVSSTVVEQFFFSIYFVVHIVG